MIFLSLRNYHEQIIQHMMNMGYVWNGYNDKEGLFLHEIRNHLDCSVNRFLIHLDQIKFFKTLFLQRNITYYLVCLTLYTTVDVYELLDNLDKSLLYRLMAKNNCNLLKRRILRRLKQIVGDLIM